MPHPTLEHWHQIVKTRDARERANILAEHVVFESPVVHTPQVGKAITLAYLQAALSVLNNEHFHYLNQWESAQSAVLEFQTICEGITVNGVDIIHWNDAGRIDHFKVMVRPLKAINTLHALMGQVLQQGRGQP
ncbi:MAG: nuclear transport factor 2 family protein [Burkholderiaceae bacterium]|uniref:nuclear transport factor 2 family protein n=1 Tax=Hydrogenophaga sp. TaxID=1904254 RepID=UPI002759E09D|nr:nuclear transport factor 2 family protein [Hydrogenophaga sp.]MDP2065912.1 nuclear transport factor 2 family protein [Burkholderiaceae bacterium]MDZ4144022.1 nuclear transport factor 2 family protein [Burkholderiales bacterium]MDZ4398847.1 nuclear transport factor 2 family protein [Hydrogenophaga sp.]